MSLISDLFFSVGLIVLLLITLELGFRLGRRGTRESSDAPASTQVGAVQGAVLGLLGLLLAFSFAAAQSRFLERQDLIVQEANAVGTSYLRADLLDDPHKSDLRSALQRYTQYRIDLSKRVDKGLTDVDTIAIDRMQAAIWSAASAGVKAKPETMFLVLPPVNEVIDLHTTRVAAVTKHLPPLVTGMLIVASALALGVIGYGSGMGGCRRAPITFPLAILVGASLWVTYDLDHPRKGFLRLDDAPLQALKFDGGSP